MAVGEKEQWRKDMSQIGKLGTTASGHARHSKSDQEPMEVGGFQAAELL